jgi:hypothetical protein
VDFCAGFPCRSDLLRKEPAVCGVVGGNFAYKGEGPNGNAALGKQAPSRSQGRLVL